MCRFDSEQTQAQEEVQRERGQREKLGREKDMLTGEVFSLRQQLEVGNIPYIMISFDISFLTSCDVHVSVCAHKLTSVLSG